MFPGLLQSASLSVSDSLCPSSLTNKYHPHLQSACESCIWVHSPSLYSVTPDNLTSTNQLKGRKILLKFVCASWNSHAREGTWTRSFTHIFLPSIRKQTLTKQLVTCLIIFYKYKSFLGTHFRYFDLQGYKTLCIFMTTILSPY